MFLYDNIKVSALTWCLKTTNYNQSCEQFNNLVRIENVVRILCIWLFSLCLFGIVTTKIGIWATWLIRNVINYMKYITKFVPSKKTHLISTISLYFLKITYFHSIKIITLCFSIIIMPEFITFPLTLYILFK